VKAVVAQLFSPAKAGSKILTNVLTSTMWSLWVNLRSRFCSCRKFSGRIKKVNYGWRISARTSV
jgi:hypothetical protein